jgi:hypothetical protein
MLVVAALCVSSGACRRAGPPRAELPPIASRPSDGPESLLGDVIDPWRWSRAAGATDRAQAIESIGPYERVRPGDPASPLLNTNAHYWTALAGLAWDRDIDIDFTAAPVDLDGDGTADTAVTRHVHAPGGILANPEMFGLIRTPADPRGRVGRISASTGVLGLREALNPDGTPTGEIGMTCWLCHGGENPVGRAAVLGLPGAAFDYGLLLATAAALDESNAVAAGHRRAHKFPAGQVVRARLLLAGPGRQDLTGEFGLDVTVPGFHSARYRGTARVRQGTIGIVNPISVPGILAAPGLALENWSGSEDADAPWLERLIRGFGGDDAATRAAFGLPSGDRVVARRALLLDLRNLGTLGLQDDSFPGLLWADAIYGRVEISAAALSTIPPMYAAAPVRKILADETAALVRPLRDPAQVARGRTIFSERIVGEIANRQILKHAPRSYAAAKLEPPILAPIDPTKLLTAKLIVRCADCHAAAPLEQKRPLAENPPPFGRCTHCHLVHPFVDDLRDRLPAATGATAASKEQALIPIATLVSPAVDQKPASPSAEVAFCAGCHNQHRDFGPVVYSSGRLFPFDVNDDGDAQGDSAADARAGGIGTEPLLAFDVPRDQRPFTFDVPVIMNVKRSDHVGRLRMGVGWVRTAPLLGVFATAPYLHNGSVPTLAALLEPTARRPRSFSLGRAGFAFDTRIPGNGNQGHEFGVALSDSEKKDLIAFLETL